MNQQEVAQVLKKSGLFDDLMGLVGEINQTHPNIPSHELEPLPYPTADQAEAVLGEMGLQVVRERTDGWELWDSSEGVDSFLFSIRCDQFGQRTLANNAALAWLANQPDWKPKLKEALERLGWCTVKK